MAHMFYGVRSTIVDGERGLMESPGKFGVFYLVCERRSRDLIERLAHSVISKAFTKRALVPIFIMVLFIVGERLTWWSS